MVLEQGADGGEHCLHVDAVFVGGQRHEPRQVNVVLLAEHLHQRGVECHVFVAGADDIVVATLADDVHGQQDEGGEAWTNTLRCLKPFQHAKHEEQTIGSVFFQGGARGAIQSLEGLEQVVVGQI